MDKEIVRKNALMLRRKLDFELRIKYDNRIYQRLIESELYKNSKNIFVYISFRDEVDTKTLLTKMLRDNKNVYVPKVSFHSNHMEAIKILSFNNLEENRFGTLEPVGDKDKVDPQLIDLVITPGVAFDESGNRVGFGKGYYDRFFKRTSPDVIKIGLSYEIQMVDCIDCNDFDEKLDYIITERRVIQTNKY